MDNIKRVILKLSGEALAKKEGGYNDELIENIANQVKTICLLYTSPSPRDTR